VVKNKVMIPNVTSKHERFNHNGKRQAVSAYVIELFRRTKALVCPLSTC